MNFTEHTEFPALFSANEVLKRLSEEQRGTFEDARRQYNSYLENPNKYDELEGEMGFNGWCDRKNDSYKEKALNNFFKRYPDSISFHWHLKMLLDE